MSTIAASSAVAALALAPLFTDHMVIQQGRENPIWGTDAPNAQVVIKIDGDGAEKVVTAKADATGKWSAELPQLPAGGPYTIKVDGTGEDILDDVLVGEVWLVSGQSNMEFRVDQGMAAKMEIATANNSRIRHFKVEQCASPDPLDTVKGDWETASPATAGNFSAIGYFFAKEICERLNVPVGIINSTWGGTCVEAWTSFDTVSKYIPEEELHPTVEVLAKRHAVYEQYLVDAKAWRIEHMPADPGNFGFGKGWANISFDDSGWESMALPNYCQAKGIVFNGAFWFRKSIDIPTEWAGKDLTLSLGSIDDYDTTYFNGVQVGETPRGTVDSYQLPRVYTIPASEVKAGKAIVTVRVFDDFGNGGFGGVKSSMWIAPKNDTAKTIALAGDWKMKVEHNIGVVPASVFAGSPGLPGFTQPQNCPAYLYNGMINALVPYGIRGALWYQGEQNESTQDTYGERVRAMIRDWRSIWNEGNFPFYYVQLASFNSAYPWAGLRHQQDAALLEPNTGRALAIDIGNPKDIHPKNKQDVAHRLALNALAKDYGFADVTEYSGPVCDKVTFASGKAEVSFTHAKELHTTGNALTVLGFELAGADGIFHTACGKIEGDVVSVMSKDVSEPVKLRYAWADAPEVNLVNGDNLPAAPFVTDK